LSELDVTCPDCGTTYQCTSEQAGKLLHCKCGRYLVAGSVNEKTVEADTPAPPPAAPSEPPTAPAIAVKRPAVVIPPPEVVTINVKNPVHVAPPPPPPPEVEEHPAKSAHHPAPAAALDQKTLMMIGGGIGVVVLLVLAFVLLRPGSKPATSPASTDSTASTGTTSAPSDAGCTGTPARLDNGEVVARSPLGSGSGKLEIDNQSPTDVSVRLVGSGSLTVSWIYVQQGQTARITTVPLGTQRLLYSAGSDWDAKNLAFRCNGTYSELDKALEYEDRRVDDRTIYSSYKVIIGKAKAGAITKEDFFRGHMRRTE